MIDEGPHPLDRVEQPPLTGNKLMLTPGSQDLGEAHRLPVLPCVRAFAHSGVRCGEGCTKNDPRKDLLVLAGEGLPTTIFHDDRIFIDHKAILS